ncbi:spermidine synthase [Sphingomonas radiodurans]|uniref:spermidine synthase n=1 Tax=Sphingomonas radiodurans TaxID=2890321 RepID=UPI001E2C76CD|nr:fused MFS/spermidine synthase [Sphingomonas radiodurans]WBH17583.1 fused MFS/spermidine synthase [Sphingomonas radiodurans]
MTDTTRAPRVLFVATILAGSFLLFLVQPMVARIALPRLGGAPAVWNSAMLVYQALLLAGYGYAHALGRVSIRRQAIIHLALLAVAMLWLPIGVLAWPLPEQTSPELWVPWLFAASIGPLFVAVSAQAPLMQRWFAAARPGEDPYRLYAASNLGSFAGLIAYPLLVEPLMPVDGQRWLWSAGYVALIVLVALIATRLPRGHSEMAVAADTAPPTARRIAHWIALALVPSGLMLATSTYITTDIVAMPLLWVIPLGLYLLSFTVAFADNRAPADFIVRVAPVTILLFGGIMIGGFQIAPLYGVGLALMLLFMASVALHTAMYRLRPAPERLTGFYLAMSIGGALGGLFAGLLAPALFDWTWEYPLLILAAGALVPQMFLAPVIRTLWSRAGGVPALAAVAATLALLLALRQWASPEYFGEQRTGLAFGVITIVGLASIGARHAYVTVLAVSLALFGGISALRDTLAGDIRTRSYFGVYRIAETPDERTLAHGTTLHGTQLLGTPEREQMPTTYYVPSSGVGRAMTLAPALYGMDSRIGVVGLGTGTLACYAWPGQDWQFFEIDPVVAKLARERFSFLRTCAPDAKIVLGDARLSIAQAAPGALDLLALDAFSSDSVPIHLLTREAFADYARALQPKGLLLVHISNRFLDLTPVVAAAAEAGGWRAIALVDRPAALTDGGSISHWVALSRDPQAIDRLKGLGKGWIGLPHYPGYAGWSDDYASIIPLLHR